MKGSITILHIADIHYMQEVPENDPVKSSTEKNIFKELFNKLFKKFKNENIDFIIFTGDFVERDNTKVSEHLVEIFNIIKKAIFRHIKIDSNRIIVIPGNHELTINENLHSLCCESGYTVADLVKGNFSSKEILFGDYGISFSLFNSSLLNGNDKPEISKDQLENIEKYIISDADNYNNIKKIALMHHHLLPLPQGAVLCDGEYVDSDEEDDNKQSTDVLDNASLLIDWLIKNNYFAVLHGHKHINTFVKYTTYNTTRVVKEDTPVDELKKSLYIISGENIGNKRTPGYDSTVLRIDINNVNYYTEPAVKMSRYGASRERDWTLQTAVNDDVKSELEREYYNFETDLRNRIFIKKDSIPNSEISFFEKYYKKICINNDRQELQGSENSKYFIDISYNDGYCFKQISCKDKLDALVELIDLIQEDNRNSGLVFNTTYQQLNYLYTIGSVLFSSSDVKEIASQEFSNNKGTFSYLLDPSRWNPNRTANDYNHLDWANTIISDEIDRYVDKEKIILVEGGSGSGNTLSRIALKMDKNIKKSKHIEYLGVEISRVLADNTVQFIEKNMHADLIAPIIKNVSSIDGNKLIINDDFYDALLPTGCIGKISKKIDVFVASYSFHHIQSPKRIIEACLNNTLISILGGRYLGNPNVFLEKTIESNILGDFLLPEKSEFFRKLYREINFPEDIDDDRKTVFEYKQLLDSCFKNKQFEAIKYMYNYLCEDGIVAIADPNGFSGSFNRKVIFEDEKISVSFFNEYVELCILLEKAGFQIDKIFKQIKLRNNAVSNIELVMDIIDSDGDKKFLKCCSDIYIHDLENYRSKNRNNKYRYPYKNISKSEPIIGEYDDVNLGYIVFAKKTSSPKFRFKDKEHFLYQ
jgi:pentatricopeptide repeat protein